MSNFSEVLEELRNKKQINKQELAKRAGLAASYVSHLTLGSRENPSEETLKSLSGALTLDDEENRQLFNAAGLPVPSPSTLSVSATSSMLLAPISTAKNEDWGDFPNIQAFYGRVEELDELRQWVLHDRCQMVVISGSGGIGKTMLTAKLTQSIVEEFDYVFWRSLKDAPPLENFLSDSILLLSHQQKRDLPRNIDDQIHMLINYLKERSCLLILDNMEAILQEKEHEGEYREDYEDYGRLVELIGRTMHKSCLLLTTREIPKEVVLLASKTAPVRVFALKGLKPEDGLKILEDKNLHLVDQAENAIALVERYAGNPLALKVAAEYIRQVFDGDIAAFLSTESLIFKDIQDVLEQQFGRLTPLERELMYWLTIEREAIARHELLNELVHQVKVIDLAEALQSLIQRDLIEQREGTYFLPPVILEFMTEKLVTQVVEEIRRGSIELIESHALMKAQTKDYIRGAQIRFIIEPIAQQLLVSFGRDESEERLKTLLNTLREVSFPRPGYAGGNILNLLIHMGSNLNGYDFSHLYVWQAYLQVVWLNNVNFSYANLTHTIFTDTFTSILSVELSPDNRLFAAGTENGEVRLWAANSGAPLHIFKGHESRVRSIAFSPDGRTIVSGSEDYTLRIWDIDTEQCLKILQGHTDRVRSVAISPAGNTIISGSDDGTVRIWDMQTGHPLNVLKGHADRVRAVAFSPDGVTIASGGEDYIIRLWDWQSGHCLHTLEGHEKQVHAVNFSPDGSLLASGSEDNTIRLWDVKLGQFVRILRGHENQVRSVAFSPDGTKVVSASDDQTIRLWEVQSGQWLKTMEEHLHRVYSASFSPDGSTIISGSEDQTIRLWDVQSGRPIKTLQGYINQIRSVAFNPAGTILVSGGDDHQLRLWNVSSGQHIRTLQGHTNGIRGVTFSPDGEKIASCSDDRTIRLWHVQTGKSLKIFREHTDRVRTIAFSPDGAKLASGSEDHSVRIWDTATGQRLMILHGHTDWVRSVIFSPDGTLLVSGGEDYSLRVWNVQSGECLQILKGHKNGVRSVCFSPDGSVLASGGDDETIQLWKTATWKNIKIFQDPIRSGWILSVTFSPDGTLLASGSEDYKVRIWDAQSGQCQKRMEGHEHRIYSVAFHPDEHLLASGSLDGTIRLWDVKTGEFIKILSNNKPYQGMNVFGAQGLTDIQKTVLEELGAIVEE